MKRRNFLKAAGIALAGLGLLAGRPAEAQTAPRKPNIIFILADDIGLGDVSCYGGDTFKTPNIDKLAQTGVRFEYSYAAPLCGPSRCQLLTGRYPFRTGLVNNACPDAIAPSREIMMPTVLKKAGYVTGEAGKWGQMCLTPRDWGFDEYLTFPSSGLYWSDQRSFFDDNGQRKPEVAHYDDNGQRKELLKGQYMPDIIQAFALDFVNRHKEQPFYLYYPMVHVHSLIERTPDSKPDSKDLYADNIAYMDKLVGNLMGELDRLHLRENTLIIFTGDNGTAQKMAGGRSSLGGRPILGWKGNMLEGGSRVPLIANWPGTAPAGMFNHDLTDFSDFFPTLAELAGAKLPEGVAIDGQSFAPQIKGEKGTPRQWVCVQLNHSSYVRDARWKLTDKGKLFDLKDAPFAETEVAKDATDAETLSARQRLQKIMGSLPKPPAASAAVKGNPVGD